MRIILAVVLALTAFCGKAQTTDLASVDSLLLIPFPADTLKFNRTAYVEVNGRVGQLMMNDSSWAWNEDTASARIWRVQLKPAGPLMTLDLESKRGLLEMWPTLPDRKTQWEPTGLEDRKLGLRTRMFSSGGDTLWVVANGDFPNERQILEWHRIHFPHADPLDRMPRQVTPLAFNSQEWNGWEIKEIRNEPRLLIAGDVLLFDPNRTFMDVVREQRGQR